MELSVAIQAKVEVTPSNWNFGFQPTFIVYDATYSSDGRTLLLVHGTAEWRSCSGRERLSQDLSDGRRTDMDVCSC